MKMRADCGVNIQLPKPGTGEEQDVITITGYEGKAEEAKQAILAIVNEYVSPFISFQQIFLTMKRLLFIVVQTFVICSWYPCRSFP